MFDQFFSLASRVSERGISEKLKLVLGLLFVGSISSYTFKYFYFNYQLIDVTDYQSYYNYFVNGYFFIPMCIFIFVWISTELLGLLLFKVPNLFLSGRLRKAVVNFSIAQLSIFDQVDPVIKGALAVNVNPESKNWVINLFKEIKKVIKPADLKKVEIAIKLGRERIEKEFTLLVRALGAAILYALTIEYFSGTLLFAVLMFILVWMSLLFVSYQFIEITPIVILKIMSVEDTHPIV